MRDSRVSISLQKGLLENTLEKIKKENSARN